MPSERTGSRARRGPCHRRATVYRDARIAQPPSPEFLAALPRMTPEQRLRAYRRAALSRSERTAWAARYPDEVPLLNGELPWIALDLADLD